MKILTTILTLFAGTAVLAQAPGARGTSGRAANNSQVFMDTVAAQVMLDRAGFSAGEIDGKPGPNLERAISAYQRSNGLPESAQFDEQLRQKLAGSGSQQPLTNYQIGDADVAGPFTASIPEDLVAQSKLERLGYRNALEAIAERFHTSPQLLQRLNPGASLSRVGEQIQVPNVEPFDSLALAQPRPTESPEATPRAGNRGERPQPRGAARGRRGAAEPPPPQFTIAVTKSTSTLTVEDSTGRVIFHAPVTTGSEHDPLPIGNWKVTTVQVMPKFHYNPELFWDANPTHSKATIQPGPNNPVGVAWIDINKEHYGIHGTPEPSRIGHVQSHGCVRLTNWDVARLLKWAQPNTPVVFRE